MGEQILADIEASGIYQIRNLINGKRYIGSAKCFRTRWNGHRAKLRRGSHHSRHLQSSWVKHGESAFFFEVIELCDVNQLLVKEQAWLDRESPEFNVCPTAGNTLGRKFTQETKDKIAARAIGRKVPPRSVEYRKKLSLRFKGVPKSPEHLQALQDGRARHVYTDEQRAAISKSLLDGYANGTRKKEKSESHKNKIGQFYAKLTDDEVREIRKLRSEGITGRELAKRYGSNTGTISAICRLKRYRWVS